MENERVIIKKKKTSVVRGQAVCGDGTEANRSQGFKKEGVSGTHEGAKNMMTKNLLDFCYE